VDLDLDLELNWFQLGWLSILV